MPNPISEKTRGALYVTGISLGIMSTVAGPLMLALAVPEVWVAVVLSTIGALTTLLSTLARANLTAPDPGSQGITDPLQVLDFYEHVE